MTSPIPGTLPRLHVLTPDAPPSGMSLPEYVQRVLDGGADAIQLRSKIPQTDRDRWRNAIAVSELCRESGAQFIVNDRADIARVIEGAGAHVGKDDLTPGAAREVLGPGRLLGMTTNDEPALSESELEPVDYVGIGPVFGTKWKAGAPDKLGLAAFENWAKTSRHPVIAIGSIAPHQVEDLVERGAYGVAVISGVAEADDPTAATAAYRERLDAALAHPR